MENQYVMSILHFCYILEANCVCVCVVYAAGCAGAYAQGKDRHLVSSSITLCLITFRQGLFQ